MVKWLLLLSLLVARPASAGDGLDVKAKLAAPGVKLLVVEFYSVYCKPCMRAVPRWRALHKKYRKMGLRFVVISADPGTCAQPDWTPDDLVCDEYGTIQSGWKVDALPQAFLWDWQGRMLVKRGEVDDIERAVEAYFKNTLRIGLTAPTDGHGKRLDEAEILRSLVRGELHRAAKFDVLMTDQEAASAREARKTSHELSKAKSTTCDLGQEISANSLLHTRVVRTGKGALLVLELISVERGCLVAFARSPLVGDDYETAVLEAVGKLVKVLVHFKDPRTVSRLASSAKGDRGAKVAISVQPPGASWVLDSTTQGTLDPEKNVTVLQVAPGKHELELSLKGHVTRSVSIYVERGELKTVQETLVPRIVRTTTDSGTGFLNIKTTPVDGAAVHMDGKDMGKTTPVTMDSIPVGRHVILLKRRFYKDKVVEVVVPADDVEKVAVVLEPNFGSLSIGSIPTGADIYIDGVREGTTPFEKERMESKAYKIKLSYALHHDLEGTVFVKAGEAINETFTIPPAHGKIQVEATSQGRPLRGATVLLDLEDRGQTPALLDKIRSKKYEITVKYLMHRDFVRQIEVRDGETTLVQADLDANFGTLKINATPADAEILIDDKTVGRGRVEKNLAVGEHTIAVIHRNRSYKPVKRKIALALNETLPVNISLTQMTGDVLVSADPPGGELYLDDEHQGSLPLKLRSVVVGTHKLRLEKKGFTPTEEVITVLEGELSKVRFRPSMKASLSVTCGPGEGRIELDGEEIGKRKAKASGLESGRHTITCKSSGYVMATEEINARPAKSYKLDLRLDTPELLTRRYEMLRRRHLALGWTGILTGAAAAGVSIWSATSYFSASDRYDAKLEEYHAEFGHGAKGLLADVLAAKDDMKLHNILGWSMAAAGVAAAVFGIVQFATMPDAPDDDLSSRYSVLPILLPSGTGLSLGLRW